MEDCIVLRQGVLLNPDGNFLGYGPEILLKGYPVNTSLVPLLQRETVRFEDLADLCRIPVK
jgi:hypothetical protein